MSKNGLGKGFEGLIPVGLDVSSIVDPGEQVKQLSVDLVFPNPDQPRKNFDEQAISELAESIKTHGVIQPLVVTPSGEGYRIVAGERRYRASQKAGLKKIPAIIRNHKALEELEIALVENVQRVDLSPLEQAVSIVRLRDQFSLTPAQIAKKLGKAETTISNIVRLLRLPESAIRLLQEGKITEGHARALLALKDDQNAQRLLEQKIVSENISVREAEDWVKQHKKHKEQKSSSHSATVSKLLKEVNAKGYTIKVQEKKRGGVIQLAYSNEGDLVSLLNKFK